MNSGPNCELMGSRLPVLAGPRRQKGAKWVETAHKREDAGSTAVDGCSRGGFQSELDKFALFALE